MTERATGNGQCPLQGPIGGCKAGYMLDLFGRYVFRQFANAFLIVLLSLTAIVWVAAALRELDLLTSKGQSLLLFLQVTGLSLPNLMSIIAPNALLMAALYTMDRLNGDSELIVISAAGASVWRLAAPLLLLTAIVSVVLTIVTFWLVPASMRSLRSFIIQVRTDLISQVLQPGRFSSPDANLTFHIRDRDADGTLLGLMVHDGRDKSQIMTYFASRGRIVSNANGAFLVMQDGQIHRKLGDQLSSEVQIVEFEQYAFDISQFGPKAEADYLKPKERSIGELLNPDPNDPYYQRYPGQYRAELHNRVANVLYPIAFVLLGVVFVGRAQSLRQKRWHGVVLAFAAAVVLRIAGFAATNLNAAKPSAAFLVYALPVGAILIAAVAAHVRMAPRRRHEGWLGLPLKLRFPNDNMRALWGVPAERRRGSVG